MIQLKIKVCGMKEATNIVALSALQPDFMGMIFYDKSPRNAENLEASVVLQLPRSIKRVGVFVNATTDFILKKIDKYELDMLQLHGNETPDFCRQIQKLTSLPIMKAFGIDEKFDADILCTYENSTNYFLFDTKTPQYGGSGQAFDWEILKRLPKVKPIFISGGITPSDALRIKALSQSVEIFGVDINSKFENAPGLKNIPFIKEFINEIRK
jgi:phosphoribosylanthranilate isomerase